MSALYPEKTPEEIADSLGRYHIVDVRETSEFEGPLGHLDGAHLVVLGELEARVGELPSEVPLLIVCRSGNRSGRACELLARHGRPGATNLVGGMIAWHAAGLPVTRKRFKNARAILDAFGVWLSQVKRLPPDDAVARVRAMRETVRAEDTREGMEASPASVAAETITRIERELRAEDGAPADLGLVCTALRADAKALDKRAEDSPPSTPDGKAVA